MTTPSPSPPNSTAIKRSRADLIARMARTDPTVFLQLLLKTPGRPIRPAAAVHVELQEHLTRHRMALVELPRDHGKTTQVCGRVLWELGRDPNLRVKLVCATDALATERTRFLRTAIESHPAVRTVLPDLVPGSPWTARAFTVRRTREVIGPSVAAFGVGCGSTGARADLLVCDDIVDVRSMHSRADRERVKAYFRDNLLNLLEPDGRFWGLSTPWHPDDLNAELKHSPAFAVLRRAVGGNLEPVWAEKWPEPRLAERRGEIGSSSFTRGYQLEALGESDVTIRPEWVRYWDEELPRGAFDQVVLAVDPAVSAKQTADGSALVVLGKVEREVRCLQATAYRVASPVLVDLIHQWDLVWQPDVILFESNAAFAGLRDLMVSHAAFGPKVRGVVQSRSKLARLAGLAVAVENGCVRLRGDGWAVHPSQRQLFEELTGFPYRKHDDLADAAATGAAYLFAAPQPRAWAW